MEKEEIRELVKAIVLDVIGEQTKIMAGPCRTKEVHVSKLENGFLVGNYGARSAYATDLDQVAHLVKELIS